MYLCGIELIIIIFYHTQSYSHSSPLTVALHISISVFVQVRMPLMAKKGPLLLSTSYRLLKTPYLWAQTNESPGEFIFLQELSHVQLTVMCLDIARHAGMMQSAKERCLSAL